jgi:hypothetical protein
MNFTGCDEVSVGEKASMTTTRATREPTCGKI